MRALRPESFPAYHQVRVDPAGRIWIHDYNNVQPRGWTVFTADGELAARVVVPRSQGRLVGFGADHVVVRHQDGDGAAVLAIHDLVPVEGSPSGGR